MKNICLLTYLYGLQGLPHGLQTNLLPLVLRKSGYKLWNLNFIHALSLPWLLKGILATWLKNQATQRKYWICCSLLLSSVSFTGIGLSLDNFNILIFLLFLNSLLAVLMDIAVDATAISFVNQDNVGLYNIAQVVAYKFGALMISVLFVATGDLSTTFISLLYIFGAAATQFYLREEKVCCKLTSCMQTNSLKEKSFFPCTEKSKKQNNLLKYFQMISSLTFTEYRTKMLVLLCLLYKIGEKGFTTVFPLCMVDRGMDIKSISFVSGVGQGGSLLGSIAGGMYFKSFCFAKMAILVCCLSMSMLILVISTFDTDSIFIYCGIDTLLNICSGFITTWTFSQMMNSSKNIPEHLQAMHYSLLSTIELFGKLFFTSFAGFLADAIGYIPFFCTCCVLQFSLIFVVHGLKQI